MNLLARLRSARTKMRRGFTLIELMITVAIMGILASIAISSYSSYLTDARVTEAQTMLADIRAKMEAYYNTWGAYISASANPAAIPDENKGTWDDSSAAWQEIGVSAGGPVGWRYTVVANTNDTMTSTRAIDTSRDYYYVTAEANLDGNTSTQQTMLVVDSQNSTASVFNKGQ